PEVVLEARPPGRLLVVVCSGIVVRVVPEDQERPEQEEGEGDEEDLAAGREDGDLPQRSGHGQQQRGRDERRADPLRALWDLDPCDVSRGERNRGDDDEPHCEREREHLFDGTVLARPYGQTWCGRGAGPNSCRYARAGVQR